MPKSTTIVAFDHHAATTVAAVLLADQRTPALHALTSDLPTILRFVERLRRAWRTSSPPHSFHGVLAIASNPIVVMPASSPSSIGPARSRRSTFPPSRKRPRAISSVVAKTSASISSALATACPNSCCATAAASRRPKRPGRSGTPNGYKPSAGRCRRSSRPTAPMYAPSMKASHDSRPSIRSCATSSPSTRCGRASSACAASAASTI